MPKARTDGLSIPEAKAIRCEWIKRMLIAGFAEATIVRKLAQGVNVAEEGKPPLILQCTAKYTYQDLRRLGQEWRKLHDDPEVQERVFGGMLERLSHLSRAAEAKGDFNAAIRAEMARARLWGLRSPRWADAGRLQEQDDAAARVAAADDRQLVERRAVQLAQLSDEELEQREAQLGQRVGHLRALRGGRAEE